ncbi:MAG: DUF2157 domain-containing protein, partial [Desulfuromonadaceae bacterium]
MHKDQAQTRTDRIHAFREELAALQREEVLVLAPEQQARIESHHQALLDQFAALYDVDISGTEKQLSWGMRIVSFLGA